MSDQWYYRKDGQSKGPVSRQRIGELAQRGEIEGATLVWQEGLADWTTASSAGLIREGAAKPPPLSLPVPPPPPVSPPFSQAPHRRGSEPAATPARSGSPAPAAAKSFPPRPGPPPMQESTKWLIVVAACGLLVGIAGAAGWVARGVLAPEVVERPVAAQVISAGKEASTKQPNPVSTPASSVPVPSPETSEPAAAESPASRFPAATSPPGFPAPATPTSPLDSTTPTKSPPTVSPIPPTSSPTAPQPQPSTPAKEQTLFQEIDVQRAPKFSILGMETGQNLRYAILSELKIGPPDERGIRTVGQTVLDTKLTEADELSRPMFEASLRDLKGWQFSYKLSRDGEVLEIKSGPPSGRKAAAVEPKGAKGFLVTSVMDEDGWKELAQLSFYVPSEQASSQKLPTRQMTHHFGPLGSWYGETHFTRGMAQSGILQINYAHKMTYRPPERDTGELPFAIKDIRFTPDTAGGAIYYDTKARRVVSAQDQFLVRGTIASEVLGQALEVQVQEQQAINLRIVEQNPWQQ